MPFLILIRHGESESNLRGILSCDIEGYPLTGNGRKQASKCLDQLRGTKPTGVFTSPVQRTRETAGIIAHGLGVTPIIDPRLAETDMGSLNNTSAREAAYSNRLTAGVESWSSQVERMRDFMKGVSGNTVAVSHAMPIRALISSIMEMDELESLGIDIGFASLTIVNLEEQRVESIGARGLTSRLRLLLSGEKDNSV